MGVPRMVEYRSNERKKAACAPQARALGDLLLTLYEAARTPSVDAFQSKALACILKILPFDYAINGIGIISSEKVEVKAVHTWNEYNNTVEILNRYDRTNIVGRAILEHPGTAHAFSTDDLINSPNDEELWAQLGGLKHVLCYGSTDQDLGLFSFFVVARRSADHPFTASDCCWVELLAPHLEAMLGICRVSELQQLRLNSSPQHARSAVSDARGVLHVAEPGFVELLREGWPKWRGPNLPSELIDVDLVAGTRELQRGHITVAVSGVAQQLVITASRRAAFDLLTIQEQAVAQAFAQGLSYKEVARMLGRSPATVRHHLRSVYIKLSVRDKGALARTIFGIAEVDNS